MPADAFIGRSLTVDGKAVVCRFFQPELQETGEYGCRYEIEWPEGVSSKHGYGIDEVQALLLAMQRAHIDLLVAREHHGRDVLWLDERSLGLPIPESIRDWDPENRL